MNALRLFLQGLLAGAFFRKAVANPIAPVAEMHPRFLSVPFFERDGSVSVMQFRTGCPDARSIAIFNLITASVHEQGQA